MTQNTFSLQNFDFEQNNQIQSCRFIPSRHNLSRQFIPSPKHQEQSRVSIDSVNDENKFYKDLLKKNLNQEQHNKFTQPKPQKKLFSQVSLENLEQPFTNYRKKSVLDRKVSKVPFKVLDAPFLQDDYYLNVIDWSKSNDLAVALGPAVYTWNFENNTINKVAHNAEDNFFSSVTFNSQSNQLATGSIDGTVQLYDIIVSKKIVHIQDHIERVAAISFNQNLLLTGSRDNCIFLYDVRSPQKPTQFYDYHSQEVCGIKWNPEGDYFASGGNDNKLFVFSIKMPIPVYKKNHKAAVKALGWSNLRRGVLATGAGTADRCLRVFDINSKTMTQEKDTGSQICNLLWSKQEDEIITAHGFSKNDIVVWRQKGLKKIVSLKGHQQRVLYLSMNREGTIVVSGAGDETLRFWNLGYESGPKPMSFGKDNLFQILR